MFKNYHVYKFADVSPGYASTVLLMHLMKESVLSNEHISRGCSILVIATARGEGSAGTPLDRGADVSRVRVPVLQTIIFCYLKFEIAQNHVLSSNVYPSHQNSQNHRLKTSRLLTIPYISLSKAQQRVSNTFHLTSNRYLWPYC